VRRFRGIARQTIGGLTMGVRMPRVSSGSSGESSASASGGSGEVTEILESEFGVGSDDFHVFYLDGPVSAEDVEWSWSQSVPEDVITERHAGVVLILSCFDAETVGTITVNAVVDGDTFELVFDP
jgi:hypothetical protein